MSCVDCDQELYGKNFDRLLKKYPNGVSDMVLLETFVEDMRNEREFMKICSGMRRFASRRR